LFRKGSGQATLADNTVKFSCGCTPVEISPRMWYCSKHFIGYSNPNAPTTYNIDGREYDLSDKPTNPKDLIGSNKLPLSVVPSSTKAYLALGHSEGHLKYGYNNFRHVGVRARIYIDALYRHIDKWMEGEEEDPETGVPHLANALTCLSIIVDAKECGKLIDDRPESVPVTGLQNRFAEKLVKLKQMFADKKPVDYFITGPKERE
jgi:hypothetical protein